MRNSKENAFALYTCVVALHELSMSLDVAAVQPRGGSASDHGTENTAFKSEAGANTPRERIENAEYERTEALRSANFED